MKIFEIPEQNIDQLREKVEKLSRRSKKLSQYDIAPHLVEWATIDKPLVVRKNNNAYSEFLNEEENARLVQPQDLDLDNYRVVGYRQYFVVELVGVAPVVDGWELIGVIEHTGNSEIGNIVRDVPGKELPKKYRDATSYCEHCNVNRRRLETFVLRELATDTYKQVGRNCLADFCRSPEYAEELCAWAEYIKQLEGLCDAGEEEEGSWGGRIINRIKVETALAFTARLIRLDGWLSRSKQREMMEKGENPKTATADTVKDAFFDPGFWKVTDKTPYTTVEWLNKLKEKDEKDNVLAVAALEWIRAKVKEKDELNDYLYNLLVVASDETVLDKHLGILCSLISTYQREMGLLEQKKVAAEKSHHVGTVDKREKFANCKLVGTHTSTSEWGTKYLCRFNQDGAVIIWWSSTDIITEFQIGDYIDVTGRVKKHSDWNGIAQTELTRCKLTKSPTKENQT